MDEAEYHRIMAMSDAESAAHLATLSDEEVNEFDMLDQYFSDMAGFNTTEGNDEPIEPSDPDDNTLLPEFGAALSPLEELAALNRRMIHAQPAPTPSIGGTTPYKPPPRVAKRPGIGGGAVPKLDSATVDMIRQHNGTNQQTAAEFGVSPTTIAKVRGTGKFVGYRYVPADKYVERPSAEQRVLTSNNGGKKGRPFKHRTTAPSQTEIFDMIYDKHMPRDVARDMDVSHTFVIRELERYGLQNLKRMRHRHKNGVVDADGFTNDIDRIEDRLLHGVTPVDIANEFGIAIEHVERLRDGWWEPVTMEHVDAASKEVNDGNQS